MDKLYIYAKDQAYQKYLKSVISNITRVVKHSGVWSNYKLKDLMEVVFKVLKMDKQMQEAGRDLDGKLRKNFEDYVHKID